MPQLDITCHQVKSPVPGMGYVLSSHWPEGFSQIPQTLQPTANAIGYPPQHEEVELVPSQ